MSILFGVARHVEAWLCGIGILYVLQLLGWIGAIALPS